MGKLRFGFELHRFKTKFVKSTDMAISVEDLGNSTNFRLFLTVSYKDLMQFVFDYLKKKSGLTFFYWSFCLVFLSVAIFTRVYAAGKFPESKILFHTALGMIILPVIIIPVHEFLHVIPYYLSGAKNIRVGMDLKQYLFYVTAHRYAGLIVAAILLPGLWKWSLSLFLFVHATMCAGDIALLNLYWINKNKKIYTWDDVDKKEAYFYEKLY